MPELAFRVSLGPAVPAVGIDRDLLVGRVDLVVRGVHGRGRADVVHQPDADQRRGRDPAGEQRAVDVAERVQRLRDELDVLGQELRDLGVGRMRRERDRPLDVAQERHVGVAHGHHVRPQRGGREREGAALASPADRHRARRPGQLARGVDRERGVGEHPGVVVLLRGGDAAGHDQGVLGTGADTVGRRPARPPAALAPAVHHQDRVAERGQQDVLGRGAPAAAVADELDHHAACPPAGRRDVPGADALPGAAGELDVGHLERRVQAGLVSRDGDRPGPVARLAQPGRPPAVEPVRLLRARAVFAQPLERQVVPGHDR